jgi:glutaredoxin
MFLHGGILILRTLRPPAMSDVATRRHLSALQLCEVPRFDYQWSGHHTSQTACPVLSCCFDSGKRHCCALESLRMPESRNVVIYSRKGCHLCEVVKESLSKLSRRGGFTWQEIDVDADSELRRQFNDEVPVVFIDGRKAFKYRMDEQEFLRKLAS